MKIGIKNEKFKIPSHCTNENSTTNQKRVKKEENLILENRKKNNKS